MSYTQVTKRVPVVVESEPGEKSPLIINVTTYPERPSTSSLTSCVAICCLITMFVLFGMGLWKLHRPGQYIAYNLNAANPNTSYHANTSLVDIDLQVKVTQGVLQGKQLLSRAGRNYSAFLGIPYAEPPLGELRFQPPVKAAAWEGVRDATYFRDNCIEKARVTDEKLKDQPDVTDGSEDCLYLNVYTPRKNAKRNERLPVMVYFHGGAGGAFGVGMKYGADYFMDEDVVLITFEYRLGVIGNLNTNTTLASGNQGMKDHLMALQWVQDNIRYFGGDRHKVTIFGNSFGGIQVTSHMVSPLGKGLYHRAIAQSGTLLYPGFFTENPLHDARRLGDLIGCSTGNSTHEDNIALTTCLKNASGADLVINSLKFKNKFNYIFTISSDLTSDPDKVVLPQTSLDLLQAGRIKPIPFITGIVDAEGLKDSLEVMTDPHALAHFEQNWTQILVPTLYLEHTVRDPAVLKDMTLDIRNFYLGQDENVTETNIDETNFRNFTDMYTDRLYIHPEATVMSFMQQKYKDGAKGKRRFGRRQGATPNTYFYYFNHKVMKSRTDALQQKYDGHAQYYGECHADELQFFFPFDAFPYIGMDHPFLPFSQLVVKLWVNFAKTGVPTGFEGDLTWLPVTEQHPYQYMELNENPKMGESLLKPRIEFWNQFKLSELYM